MVKIGDLSANKIDELKFSDVMDNPDEVKQEFGKG
jgi:hypothetical protein